jgi:spore coat polysaccharide biosynthesis predicted glycosyltransferase SpsG
MRLSAIAEELITRGKQVIFIGQIAELPWLTTRIKELGFSQILQSSKLYLPNPSTDVLILDSYALPLDDDFIQRPNWWRIVTISDELTPKYTADLVIHPGVSENWAPHQKIEFLAGPKYIPFRKSIRELDTASIGKQVLDILVVGGGADPFNFAEAIAQILMNIEGEFHARYFSQNSSLEELDPRFTVTQIGPELDLYATSAELVFTTASTTSLEFTARGAAVGIGCAVDNQEEYYESLAAAGVAIPIGSFSNSEWELDRNKITQLVHSNELRNELRCKAAGLFDLNGTARIVDEILKL